VLLGDLVTADREDGIGIAADARARSSARAAGWTTTPRSTATLTAVVNDRTSTITVAPPRRLARAAPTGPQAKRTRYACWSHGSGVTAQRTPGPGVPARSLASASA